MDRLRLQFTRWDFQQLQTTMPEAFQPGQLRTLQRRVKEWRTAVGRRIVLGCGEAAPQIKQQEEEVLG
jgi:hypothetical protein